jgi:alpha/beta superfamily hydrolase
MTPTHIPVVLEIGRVRIAGMVTEPAGPATGLGVMFFSPGGFTISAQRNRWAARFAGQLGEHGIHTIRFDYRGIGDSTGDLE